jgi:hypothetical protein
MNLEVQIAKIIEANGAALYDTEVVTEFDETIYRVLVTKVGGVNLLAAYISQDFDKDSGSTDADHNDIVRFVARYNF